MKHQAVAGVALAGFVFTSWLSFPTLAAQSRRAPSQTVWENDLMRVYRVELAPSQQFSGESKGGSVVVFLTAGLDGRMPPADAAWHDSGPMTLDNRGRGRFEALVVDLKNVAAPAGGVTAPEVARGVGAVAPQMIFDRTYATSPVRARNLILNDRISVTRERYDQGVTWSADPLHFHPHDAVQIYLNGGYIWSTQWLYGPDHVRRGDVRVVLGNVLHTSGNAGSDPLEFLLIIPA